MLHRVRSRTHYNNIMDLLQLVFGFVNAPLFATFLLGMFWKRIDGSRCLLGSALRHARGVRPLTG